MDTDPQESNFALAILIVVPFWPDNTFTLAWHIDLLPGLILSEINTSLDSEVILSSDMYMSIVSESGSSSLCHS